MNAEYILADAAELSNELNWATARPASCAHGARLDPASPNSFMRALVPWERKHVDANHKLDPNHTLVYTVSQDPEKRKMVSKLDTMQTVTAAAHMLFVSPIDRWFSSRESLCLQGFPCYDVLMESVAGSKSYAPMCSYNVSRIAAGLPPRDKLKLIHEAGNSMHTSVIAAVLYWLAAYTQDSCCSVPVSLSLVPATPSDSVVPKPNEESTASSVVDSSKFLDLRLHFRRAATARIVRGRVCRVSDKTETVSLAESLDLPLDHALCANSSGTSHTVALSSSDNPSSSASTASVDGYVSDKSVNSVSVKSSTHTFATLLNDMRAKRARTVVKR